MTLSKNKTAFDETRTVFIPKEYKGDDALFVAVNGRRLLVKKGETVSLPLPFAEVIRESEEMKKAAQDYIDAVSGG